MLLIKLVSGSFPVHFPVLFEIKSVEFSIILPPVTDLMFTVQYLRPEWGERGNQSGWSGDHP